MAEMLYGIKAVTTAGAQFTWVPAEFLTAQKNHRLATHDRVGRASSEQHRILAAQHRARSPKDSRSARWR